MASEILYIHKELIQGDQCADIKMTEHRTGRGRRMDYEEVNLDWGRDQRNVTKDMGSFDSKPDRGKVSATPMDPTIIGHHAQNRLRG